MFVVERVMRQILPLLIAVVGIGLLIDFYFVHTSEYYNVIEALMICGVVAPAIQQIGIALVKEEKRRVLLATCDGVATVLSLLIIELGEYVVSYVFDYPSVSYYLEPGPVINSVAAVIVSIVVIVIALYPTAAKKKIVEDTEN